MGLNQKFATKINAVCYFILSNFFRKHPVFICQIESLYSKCTNNCVTQSIRIEGLTNPQHPNNVEMLHEFLSYKFTTNQSGESWAFDSTIVTV